MTYSNSIKSRSVVIKILLMCVAILALSMLRPALLILMPLLVAIFIILFKAKFTRNLWILALSIICVAILSSAYVQEINIANNLLSLYFLFPLLVILFARIETMNKDYLSYFIKVITIILVANNCVGLIQFIKLSSVTEDAFIGFYGSHGLGLHTLSLINFLLGSYYAFKFQEHKSGVSLGLAIFFILSAVLCFYGLGLFVFVITFILFKFSWRTLFRSVIVSTIVVFILGASIYFIKKQTFLYNYENFRRVGLFFQQDQSQETLSKIPRKLLLYRNYIVCYFQDPVLFLVGSGPGTFNSRAYFLLNGEYSKIEYVREWFGVHTPKYAEQFVHPLWNSENTVLYLDGTRNEPFSSIIALLAEYGFLLFLVFSISFYLKYRSVLRIVKSMASQSGHTNVLYHFLKFSSLFILINLFTDNFLEYPEIIFVYMLLFKLVEMKANSLKINFYTGNQVYAQSK